MAGRAWAQELFCAYPWKVIGLPGVRSARIRTLRAQRAAAPRERDCLLLTNSFSSALEFRLAGLRPYGYATDGRSLLLHRAIPVPEAWRTDMHTVEYYRHLAACLSGQAASSAIDRAPDPRLRLDAAARERARLALLRAQAAPPYVVVCPVAQGRHHGQDKCWRGYARLVEALVANGTCVVTCPGPGEHAAAAAAAPLARTVEPLDLAAFAALLAASQLVVANDSGPGHLAAAVGAHLISIFGVTSPAKTLPRGANVQRLGDEHAWPSFEQVWGAVAMNLHGARAQNSSGLP